jgi:hypothetical protein
VNLHKARLSVVLNDSHHTHTQTSNSIIIKIFVTARFAVLMAVTEEYHIVTCRGVTIDGAWIGQWIY